MPERVLWLRGVALQVWSHRSRIEPGLQLAPFPARDAHTIVDPNGATGTIASNNPSFANARSANPGFGNTSFANASFTNTRYANPGFTNPGFTNSWQGSYRHAWRSRRIARAY
jgi:hypothetical protein